MVDDAVVDQSSLVETYVPPNDSLPRLPWAIHLFSWSADLVSRNVMRWAVLSGPGLNGDGGSLGDL